MLEDVACFPLEVAARETAKAVFRRSVSSLVVLIPHINHRPDEIHLRLELRQIATGEGR